MKTEKSIKFNFLMNTFLTMSSFIFPLITFPYTSRILHPNGTGKVALATSVISYFLMFAQLGIPTYGIKICSKIRDDRERLSQTVQELFIINMCISIFVYAFFLIVLLIVPQIRKDKALYIIISITIILNALGISWMYQALEQYVYITLSSVLFKLISLIAMFILVRQENDYIIYGGISVFASSASNICNFVRSRKYISWERFKYYDLQRHMKPILLFFSMSCASTVYLNLDAVMLGFLKSDMDVGYYHAAVKIKRILVSVVTSTTMYLWLIPLTASKELPILLLKLLE